MSRRRRSPSRSRGSSSSSYTSSSSRSEKRPETERRVDVAGMSDDALLARRRRLMDLIDTEREIAERESRRARPREEGRETSGRRGGGGESKKRRRESDEEEEEEGQIRDVGGGRDVERPPPAKAAKSGYVPPHMRGGRDAGRADAADDWRRRREANDASKPAQPKIPVPGERGFGFHSVGVGRGRGAGPTAARGDGGGLGAGPAVPPPAVAPRASGRRFEDAPVEAPVPPVTTARSKSPPPREAAVEPSDDEDDDIEAIRAAAAVANAREATKKLPSRDVDDEPAPPAPAPKVVEIEVEIPDKLEPPPRRSSRRSVSVERPPADDAPAPPSRRSSRRSVSVDPPPPPRKGAAASGLTPVEGDPAKLTCVVLKKLLSERELSTAGLKAALVARLKAALEEEQK